MLAAAKVGKIKETLCYSEFTKFNTLRFAHQSHVSTCQPSVGRYGHQLISRFPLISILLQALRPALQLKERPIEAARQGETVDNFNLTIKAQDT